MTNDEAIEMIRDDMKLHHDSLSGEYRKALRMAISALTAQPEIVRCKDCKHRPISTCTDKSRFTGLSLEFPDYLCPCQCDDGFYNWYPEDNYFCANAERKDNE